MAKRRFGEMIRESKGFEGFQIEGAEKSEDVVLIPINEICCRSTNMYVDKQDAAESLKKSIKNLGLIEPIIVIEIGDYKKQMGDSRKDEIDYLTSMEEKGCKYFISSGHRRFKAFISLALNRDMYPGNQIDYLYSQETADLLHQFYRDRMQGFINGYKEEYKFYMIPCKIEKKLIENEDEFYNQSNTTQRELSNYEVIINTIYQLDRNGILNQYKDNAKKQVIDSLSPRMLNEWIGGFVKDGIIDKREIQKAKSDEEKRELLYLLPFEKISKTKKILAQQISDFIADDSGRNISVNRITETQVMMEQINNLSDLCGYDIMSLVYAGEMNFKEAIELSRIYDDEMFSDKEREKKLKEELYKHLINPLEKAREENHEIFKIKNNGSEEKGNLEYLKLSEISKKGIKELKGKYIEKKPEKVSYTNQELIDFIYAIGRGDVTAAEVIKKIEALNKK